MTMAYHPDECKEGTYDGKSIIPAREVKQAAARALDVTSAKKTSHSKKDETTKSMRISSSTVDPHQYRKQLEHAPPKRKSLSSSSSSTHLTKNRKRYSRTKSTIKREMQKTNEFEQYLIKEKGRIILPSEVRRHALEFSMHKIVTSKDRLHNLVSKGGGEDDDNNNAERVLERIPEASSNDLNELVHSNAIVEVETDRDSKNQSHLQNGFVYQQNPMTGKFFRTNIQMGPCISRTNVNDQDEKLEKYRYIMNLLSGFSNIVCTFTNGILAGFSIHALLDISTSTLEDNTARFQNYGVGMIRFYFICIAINATGVLVKRRNAVAMEKTFVIDLSLLLLLFYNVALVLTLSIAKLELNLGGGESESDSILIMRTNVWRKLSIIRSAICIIQWIIVCFKNTTFSNVMNN